MLLQMPESDAERRINTPNKTGFTHLDPVTCSWRTLLAIGIWSIREQCLKKRVTTLSNKIKQIFDKGVLVLIRHACDLVHDITGVMFDQELSSASLKMRVAGKSGASLYKTVVGCRRICMRSCRSVVQGSEDSRRATLLNEIADDLVVEVFDFRPLNPLTNIFLLLGLEGQLDENLLQLFVDVIDTELFE